MDLLIRKNKKYTNEVIETYSYLDSEYITFLYHIFAHHRNYGNFHQTILDDNQRKEH